MCICSAVIVVQSQANIRRAAVTTARSTVHIPPTHNTQVYKQKVKHLLFEHQNNISTLKADGELALKLAADDFRRHEGTLARDKRSLKKEIKEQVCACVHVCVLAGGACSWAADAFKRHEGTLARDKGSLKVEQGAGGGISVAGHSCDCSVYCDCMRGLQLRQTILPSQQTQHIHKHRMLRTRSWCVR